MTSHSVEAVAREAVYAWMRFAPGGQPPPHEIGRLIDEVAFAMTQYAAQQVQATWEEAATIADSKMFCDNRGGSTGSAVGTCQRLADEFRRRAQHVG